MSFPRLAPSFPLFAPPGISKAARLPRAFIAGVVGVQFVTAAGCAKEVQARAPTSLAPAIPTGVPTVAARTDLAPAVAKFVTVDGSNGTVRLIHMRVIDGAGAAPSANQTIEITAGKIAAVRPTSSADVADGKATLDMSGYTVLPGLVGMHDHLYVARPDDDAEHQTGVPKLLPQMTYSAPRLYLAAGVTTIRTTGSLDPYTDLNLKKAIEANQEPGPHMDVTGPYLQGAGNPFLQMHTLTGPSDARDTVNFWARQGATSFKAYTLLTRAELKAAIDAAHAKGLKITGHLCSITYPEAAELGIDNLEHGFFPNTQTILGKKPDVCPGGKLVSCDSGDHPGWDKPYSTPGWGPQSSPTTGFFFTIELAGDE